MIDLACRPHAADEGAASDLCRDDCLHGIAARATPLWERQCPINQLPAAYDARTSRDRRRRWRKILGSDELLRRRIRCSNLSPDQIDRLLGGAQLVNGLPGWTKVLEQWLRTVSHQHDRDDSAAPADRAADAVRPLPFQEALIDLVDLARRQVAAKAGAALDVLDAAAIAALERQLLAHLSFVANLAFGRDFYEFRFAHSPAAAMETLWSQQAPSTDIYQAYVRHLQAGGLQELLMRYPVLARLLCQSVGQWVCGTADFCRRFLHDFSDLRRRFNIRCDCAQGALIEVLPDLSDRHRKGQSVLECVLSSGERLIYKPRTVLPETAFYRFIAKINDYGPPVGLKVIQTLDRETHGWVEHVPAEPCRNAVEVGEYYARAGVLLSVLHVLAVTDVHCENLIAHGAHPVVIDLETLLSERPRSARTLAASAGPEDGNSILRTALLPQWEIAPDGRRYDMSALGADDAQDPGLRHSTWQAVNTDQMILVEDAGVAMSARHRVQFDGQFPTVAQHLEGFLAGFKAGYECLLANREALIADRQLQAAFDNLELRVLVRSTETYTRLHLHLLHPEHLQDGVDRSLELEWLARPLCASKSPRRGRIQVYECERAAMESLDIPHFGTSAWRRMEHADDDEDFLVLCGERDSRVLRRRLDGLSAADCAKQIEIIKDAVVSRFGVAEVPGDGPARLTP